MATLKERKNDRTSKMERTLLITSAVIMGGFVLFVCIATNMSLALYTLPHLLLTFVVLTTILFGARHKVLTRTVALLGVVGVIVAFILLAMYLPYYFQYLNYVYNL